MRMPFYMRSSIRTTFLLSAIVIPVFAGGYLLTGNFLSNFLPTADAGVPATRDTIVAETEDTLISLIAVGDMMLGTNFPDATFLPPNGENLLDPVKGILRNADLTFGNLEGTVLNSGGE